MSDNETYERSASVDLLNELAIASDVGAAVYRLNTALGKAFDAGLEVDLNIEKYQIASHYAVRQCVSVRVLRELKP